MLPNQVNAVPARGTDNAFGEATPVDEPQARNTVTVHDLADALPGIEGARAHRIVWNGFIHCPWEALTTPSSFACGT